MKTVWKYEWPLPRDLAEFPMPAGAQILCAREQHEGLCIWALVDPEGAPETRHFCLSGTGHPAQDGKYVGTGLLMGGDLVLHVFEVVEANWRSKVMA